MKMFRSILLALAAPALALAACTAPTGTATNATDAPAQASAAVERAAAAYYRAKPWVALLVTALPPEYAARVVRAQTIAERSLAAARIATTAAGQLAELRKAEAAVRDIEAVTGPG